MMAIKRVYNGNRKRYNMRCQRSATNSMVLACLLTWCWLLVVASGFLSTDGPQQTGARCITPALDPRPKPIHYYHYINKQRHDVVVMLSLRASSSHQTNSLPSKVNPSSSSSSSSSSSTGVSEFEHWFEDAATSIGAHVDPNIQHATFGASATLLRGLSWKGSQHDVIDTNKKRMVVTIPASLVLTAPFRKNANWDRDLALQLWHECSRHADDHRSPGILTGYCQLLTLNTNLNNDEAVAPPSTAPHCLRHWTEKQKSVLLDNEQGRMLVNRAQQQEAVWRQKYDALVVEARNSRHQKNHLSWPQFQWAMEAVHSRAFCGVQALTTHGPSVTLFQSILAPVLAGAAAFGYTLVIQQEPSELVLALLAVMAVGPSLVRLATQDDDTTAVLLPLIDSANHCESADSRIDYNPLTQQFELWIGPQCLVKEENTSSTASDNDDDDPLTQLYINYGVKSDREWLLNYGFLPGVTLEGGGNDDEYRQMLAEAFLRRNP